MKKFLTASALLCVMVMVSLATPAPEWSRLAGLTFATAQAKLETVPVPGDVSKPRPESRRQHYINLAMSGLLLLTVCSLWIYFR